MSSLSLLVSSRLKYVDSKSHHVVFGYIRNTTQRIPDEITNIILIFYFQFVETFMAKSTGKGINVSDDKTIAYKTSLQNKEWESVFGSTVIDCALCSNAVCEWQLTLRYNARTPKEYFTIGIIEVNDHTNEDGDEYIFNSNEYENYAFSTNTSNSVKWLEYNSESIVKGNRVVNNETKLQTLLQMDSDNILSMKLDIRNKTVKYYGNGRAFCKSFGNINVSTKYMLAVCLYNEGSTVEITDFSFTEQYGSHIVESTH